MQESPNMTPVAKVIDEAQDQNSDLFHVAVINDDRSFLRLMMTSLPLETLAEELLGLNSNGVAAFQLAKTIAPSLAAEIETFLLSRGVVLLDENRQRFVIANCLPRQTSLSVGNPHLTRVEVNPRRYTQCSNIAPTVGLVLRANNINYAASRAVYVQQVRSHALNELAFHRENLLAFLESDTLFSVAWSGSKIADLAKKNSFRRTFKIFAACKTANQQLAPGMTVLLDLEHLSPPPSVDEKLFILRLHPYPGTIVTKKRHYTISMSGTKVIDVGYDDDDFVKGFRRGWYNDNLYVRYVGDASCSYLSVGDGSKQCKYNIRKEHDFGYENTRVMIALPDEGIVFCRGVGDDKSNPEMACVLFDDEGNVCERYGHLGKLGRWKDIVQ
ncbi:hypothetical protein CCR75_008292 [Bremia lactucae]|uniref:Uncharacterized protein n=1 Tax=Bremia lactucae TaxID=4779 RepID=A0A976FS84_BRELC|nr:hypothetical protein CCR75_008292 [Bremia lactucae]